MNASGISGLMRSRAAECRQQPGRASRWAHRHACLPGVPSGLRKTCGCGRSQSQRPAPSPPKSPGADALSGASRAPRTLRPLRDFQRGEHAPAAFAMAMEPGRHAAALPKASTFPLGRWARAEEATAVLWGRSLFRNSDSRGSCEPCTGGRRLRCTSHSCHRPRHGEEQRRAERLTAWGPVLRRALCIRPPGLASRDWGWRHSHCP